MKAKKILTRTLQRLDIEFGKDIIVHDNRFYDRVLKDHSIGMGETYIEGWWDAPDLVGLYRKIIRGLPLIRKYLRSNLKVVIYHLMSHLFNRQGKNRALRDIQAHYDIGNELYEIMLDENMVYTCAYFCNPSWTLEQAQKAKIDLVYQKLHIAGKKADGKSLKVLDIGCGWGYGLIHGAQHYGIEGVGLTLAKEQVEWGNKRAKGLPVDIRLQDYRNLSKQEKFDAIFSIGMFEHVGQKNYRKFMKIVSRQLKPDGLFLLHTIGNEYPGPVNPWMNKYIFPGASIPSCSQIAKASEGLLIKQDFHNFGLYYAKTAEHWFTRFDNGWDRLQQLRPEIYNNRFYRKWKYYLQTSTASFYEGYNQLWQFVYSKQPMNKVYEAVRWPKRVADRKRKANKRSLQEG